MQSAVETNSDSPALGAVLVVEGEILLRLVVADQLRSLGFTVLEARSGDDALVVLKTVDGVALVVMDAQTPALADGVALASWLREERPLIKVISVLEANVRFRKVSPSAREPTTLFGQQDENFNNVGL
jgi:CheY-like chemotaxis protein